MLGQNHRLSTYAEVTVASTASAVAAMDSPSRLDAGVDADDPIEFKNVQIPTRQIEDFEFHPFAYLKTKSNELTGY